MILIKIDRDSIKGNPKAGSTTTMVSGPVEITFEYQGPLPSKLEDDKNAIITEWSTDEQGQRWYNGYITNHNLVEELSKDKNISITQSRTQTVLNHPPISAYFYKYKNTKVKCNECGHEFKSKEFLSLESGFEEDYFGCTDTGCPKCKA